MDYLYFEKIYNKNYPLLVFYAQKYVNDFDTAVSIVSRAFEKLMILKPLTISPQVITRLLRSLTRNTAIQHLQNKRIELLSKHNNNVRMLHDPPLINAEAIDRVYKSIDKLSPRFKEVIELMTEGLTNNEIGAKMGLTEDNIAVLKSQALIHLERDLFTRNDYLNSSSHIQPESREQIIKIKEEVNDEFIKYYTKHPHQLYHISPRQYEIFVAELLKDMGYQVWLNKHTRDGGRDIIAVLKTPSNDSIVTIVECKKNSLDNPVPIEVVERFMYTIREKDKANAGWIVTTSTFSHEAQKCQHNYKWQLSLKNNKDLATLCSNYGKWKRTREGGLWLPDNPLG